MIFCYLFHLTLATLTSGLLRQNPQKPSKTLQCPPRPFNTLQGPSMPSKAIQCPPRPFNALQGPSMPSKALQCHSMPSKALQCHSMPFKALQGPSKPSKALSKPSKAIQSPPNRHVHTNMPIIYSIFNFLVNNF